MKTKEFVCGYGIDQWPHLLEKTSAPNPKDLIGMTKLPLRFVPPVAIALESLALADGAKKYGPFNWRAHPVLMMVYLEAALRHIYKIIDGEDIDLESGALHSAHARACLGIIMDAESCGNLLDDRPMPGAFSRVASAAETSSKSGPETSPKPSLYFHCNACLGIFNTFKEYQQHHCLHAG